MSRLGTDVLERHGFFVLLKRPLLTIARLFLTISFFEGGFGFAGCNVHWSEFLVEVFD